MRNFNYTGLRTFKETVFNIFNKYATIKRKYVHANDTPFMIKELHRTINEKFRLRNKFLKDTLREKRIQGNTDKK